MDTWKIIYFVGMLGFGIACFWNPWMGVPAALVAVVFIMESHKLKVKIHVEGEVLEKITALEHTVRQMQVHGQIAATPRGGLRGF